MGWRKLQLRMASSIILWGGGGGSRDRSLDNVSLSLVRSTVVPSDDELRQIGWGKAYNTFYGCYYYFTLDGSKTVWENPLKDVPSDDELRQIGWGKAYDRNTRYHYYFKLDRSITVWENPLSSSHQHRKRLRSPDPQTTAIQNAMEDLTNSTTVIERRSHDTNNKRRRLVSINEAAPHPMTSNGSERNDNAATSSLGQNGVNNISSHQNHHYQLQYNHYHHPMDASHHLRPLASSRQDSKCQPPNGQVKINKMNNIPQLIQAARSCLSAMRSSNTAAFWYFLAKHMNENNQLNLRYEEMGSHINQLFQHTRHTLGSFGMKNLTQTTYSMAKLVASLRKLGSSSFYGKDHIASLLSNLLLNDDGGIREDLFLSLANASVRKMYQFDARHISNLVYAYALIRFVPVLADGSDLFDHIAMLSIKMRSEFNAQEISNMVWAFATVKKRHDALFKAIGDHIVELKSLVNLLDHLRDFRPQHLSNIVWAYATAGDSHPLLFEKMANHIIQLDHLKEFNPQALSNIVWAYATAQVSHPDLFQKVAGHIVGLNHLRDFYPQAISNIVWAYATAQVSHPEMFQHVAKAAIRRKEDFNSQEVANLLWSYATMGMIANELFSSFAPIAAKLIDSYNNQELANTAWAYAVADIDAPTLFNDRFINKCLEKGDGFSIADLSQLHQWHLWQTIEKSNVGLPEALQDRCYKSFVSQALHPSKFQEDVVDQLSSIGLDPREEVLMDSGYRIDALVEVNGKTICVEVDGPYHFIGRSKSPLAKTILKRRQVQSIDGIELVSVPYWEWGTLDKSQA